MSPPILLMNIHIRTLSEAFGNPNIVLQPTNSNKPEKQTHTHARTDRPTKKKDRQTDHRKKFNIDVGLWLPLMSIDVTIEATDLFHVFRGITYRKISAMHPLETKILHKNTKKSEKVKVNWLWLPTMGCHHQFYWWIFILGPYRSHLVNKIDNAPVRSNSGP